MRVVVVRGCHAAPRRRLTQRQFVSLRPVRSSGRFPFGNRPQPGGATVPMDSEASAAGGPYGQPSWQPDRSVRRETFSRRPGLAFSVETQSRAPVAVPKNPAVPPASQDSDGARISRRGKTGIDFFLTLSFSKGEPGGFACVINRLPHPEPVEGRGERTGTYARSGWSWQGAYLPLLSLSKGRGRTSFPWLARRSKQVIGKDKRGVVGLAQRLPDSPLLRRAGPLPRDLLPPHRLGWLPDQPCFATIVSTSYCATTSPFWLVTRQSQRTSPWPASSRGLISLQVRRTLRLSPGLTGFRKRKLSTP